MRVLHVFNRYELFTRGGGVERYIHSVASHTAAGGHDVRVVAQKAEQPPNGVYQGIDAGVLELWKQVKWADVVHIHGPRVTYSALAGLFAILQKRHLAYTLHCFYDGRTTPQRLGKQIWDHAIERTLLLKARPSIVLSKYWKEYLQKRSLPARHTAILPNGIDVAAFRNEPSAPVRLEGDPSIFSISRLDPVKRLQDVIIALTLPGLDRAHLHIVGRGPDEARLRQLAGSSGVTDRVTFHGFRSDSEVAAMAQGADVFVIASEQEGMPTTILEMLARGVAVVASDIPGNRSLMQPLQTPHLYKLGDVPALAKSILAAAGTRPSPDIADRLSATFDWSVICRRMLELYR